jgi:hypothetical protein
MSTPRHPDLFESLIMTVASGPAETAISTHALFDTECELLRQAFFTAFLIIEGVGLRQVQTTNLQT